MKAPASSFAPGTRATQSCSCVIVTTQRYDDAKPRPWHIEGACAVHAGHERAIVDVFPNELLDAAAQGQP